MIDGSKIKPGDVVIGLPSSGLHTNGYTLARTVLFDKMGLDLKAKLPGVKGTLADELLQVHKNYQPLLASLPGEMIKGLAHITGGGLLDNFPRVLPKTCDAVIDCGTWKVPAIYAHIQQGGGVDPTEMYQVFNMGIGMVIVVAEKDADAILKKTKGIVIGGIVKGTGVVKLVL
jgi:phosphoribosylformylglycinamidine cyclo-ligase